MLCSAGPWHEAQERLAAPLGQVPQRRAFADPEHAGVGGLVGLLRPQIVREESAARGQRPGGGERRREREGREREPHPRTVSVLLTVTTSPRSSSQANTSSPVSVATVEKAMKGFAATPWVSSMRNTSAPS